MSVPQELLEQVYEANMALVRNDLVAWTSGNASARDVSSGLVAIKPSGVLYEDLSVDQIVVVDLDGTLVQGTLKPSTDTATHLYLYRNRADINAVIHTHSVHATAWAAAGEPIPPVLTSIADVFGGPVPCGDYVPIGGEDIGAEVLRVCGHSPAVLLRNHGVFCLAGDLRTTVRAAIMVEEVARTVALSRQIGHPRELPAEEIARQHDYYLHGYGQRSPRAGVTPTAHGS